MYLVLDFSDENWNYGDLDNQILHSSLFDKTNFMIFSFIMTWHLFHFINLAVVLWIIPMLQCFFF